MPHMWQHTVWLILALVYLLAINLVTFTVWGDDKRRAVRRSQRVSEATLLTLSALGGWPAGLLAARLYRHKTRKVPFLLRLCGIVVLQFAAVTAILLWIRSL